MRPASPPELVLATGEKVTLTEAVIAQLKSALRAQRVGNADRRDLAPEITVWLEHNPGSSTTEIASAIRARDVDVRSALNGDRRFRRVAPRPSRSRRLKAWIVAPDDARVGPGPGTSTLDARTAPS
jgi:hypothetical protein